MATELDKLIVRVQADISDLQKGLAKANGAVAGASKKMSGGFDRANASLDKFSKTAFKVGGVVATAIGVVAVKGFLDVAVQIENLQVRLTALFGSAQEGGKAFDEMAKFASKVPFSLGEIQRGSGSLAVVSDDAEHLSKLLEITGNVASVTGLSFQATAEQIQRSFAGGIASADMFREKGVRQMLGFEMGAKISVEQTAEAFDRVFGKGGKFGNASDELAKTLTGTASMIGDKFFNFQRSVGEGFFDKLKEKLRNFDTALKENELRIKAVGHTIGNALGSALDSVGVAINGVIIALKIALSVMIATFSVNILTTFLIVLNKIRVAIIAIGSATTALTGGMIKLIGKVVVAIAVFTGLNKLLDDYSLSVEKNMKLISRQEKMQKAISDVYDLTTGKLNENTEALSENAKLQKEYQEFQKKLDNIMTSIETTFDDAGKSISDAFADSIVAGSSFKDAMKRILQDVTKQIISTVLHILVIEPLIDMLSKKLRDLRDDMNAVGGFGFGNPITAGLNFATGLSTGGNPGMPDIPGMATGGMVSPNMPYMVGERGAELFVPNSAGSIVPNNKLGGGVTINQSLNFSTGVVPTVRTEIMNLMPQIKKETVSAVAEARTRGGAFARTFGA